MELDVARTIPEVRLKIEHARTSRRHVGLVPTMGALHAGHARLIERCKAEADFVVVSIFVNPTQFGPSEDYSRYPRTIENDVRLSKQAGADLVFAPLAEEMYPEGRKATYVEVPGISEILEGASRPGHFRGVATVVLKLFEIVGANVAYFGAKDYQQQLVIRRMVADLNLRIAIRTVETVREADGLALSSRNRYLDPQERLAAVVLFRALEGARGAVSAGVRDAERVRQILRETIQSEPLAQLDYAEVADADSLAPLVDLSEGQRVVALLAVRVGTTRLIDNAILTE